jgi:hypothetical protein
MQLTETERKCLILAFDRAAPDGEITAAAGRLVRLLRKRYQDGYAVIGDLESLPERPRIDFQTRLAAWRIRREIYGNVQTPFRSIPRQDSQRSSRRLSVLGPAKSFSPLAEPAGVNQQLFKP